MEGRGVVSQVVAGARSYGGVGDERGAVRACGMTNIAAPALEHGRLSIAQLDSHDAHGPGERRAVRLVVDGAAEVSLRDRPRLGDRTRHPPSGDLGDSDLDRVGT